MFSRILLGAVSVAGAIFVSAIAAAGSDGDASANSSPVVPELTVAPPTDYPDVRLGNGSSSGQGAAFNPADPKRLAIGGISSGCYVKTSADGGKTWGTRVQLPVGAGDCNSAPALTYAADGGRLYAAYLGYRPTEYLVFVSMSTDQGATWSDPTIAMARVDCFYCNGFSGARIAAAPDGRWVYVTARDLIVHDGYSASLLFSRSGDLGSSWSPVKSIASGFTFSGPPLLSSALAADRSGRVLIAYGWWDDAVYALQLAMSVDHGASFVGRIADQSNADPLSGTDIRIDRFGTAHLVYQKGSSNSGGSAILYKTSRSPYLSWSAAPVRLDVSGANPSTPLLAIGACGQTSVLHASWLESLDASEFPKKVLYTRRVAQPGYAWSDPLKVGTLKNGIYTNGLAAAGPKAFSVFAGRTSPEPQNKWGIAGSRVSSGVTCP